MAWVKNKQFSSWQKLIQRVPEESVLGPLFNIYQNGLFYLAESTNVCIFTNVYTFADGTTFYACDEVWHYLINRLEHGSYLATEWFKKNSLKLNQDKCNLEQKCLGKNWRSKNLRHSASRIWTCAESEFRLWWIKLYSSDNQYTTVSVTKNH